LRSLNISPVTRNAMLRCIKVLFSFAKAQNYLPCDFDAAFNRSSSARRLIRVGSH